jgi:glycosyltransferase involved in cell wall biosynthesis
VRDKGIFELVDAISRVGVKNPNVICVSIGSHPGLDETHLVESQLNETPHLKERFKILPSCSPDKVWEHLCAADIFAFPSHEEGMPNSLLEAMVMGVPSIAFGIPPVLEIEAGTGGLVTVPALDSRLFADAILRLSESPDVRARIGERGKNRVMESFMVRKNMARAVDRVSEIVQKRARTGQRIASLATTATLEQK